MRMWGLALLPAAAGRQAGSGGQRALRTRDAPAGPLPGAAHASVHAIPWAGPSPFAEPAGERGAGRAPHLPKATTGGDDSPGFGPRPPALPAPPEWDPGSPGRTDSREGQPGHAGDRPFLCGAPTPPSKPIFAPSLVLALCRQVSPHRQPQWLTPSHARVQDEGARSGRFLKVLWFVSSPSLCLFLRAEVIFIFCLIYYFMLINFKKREELG